MNKKNLTGLAWQLGKNVFGRYSSYETDRSQTYKLRIREKLVRQHASKVRPDTPTDNSADTGS